MIDFNRARALGRWNRREVLAALGAGAAATLLGCANGSTTLGGNTSLPAGELTNDQLMDQMESRGFAYFTKEIGASTGIVRDRANAVSGGGSTDTVGSISATGFGLTALCIGASRGYGNAATIKQQVITTLQSLATAQANTPEGKGFLYHYIDINTLARANTSEISSGDTAILLCGMLMARAYFNDPTITQLVNTFYHNVNFPWMFNGGTTYSQGWYPESGFITYRYNVYCEMMMLYLLGIGSPTYPAPVSSWNALQRPYLTYDGYTFITGNAPLFIHQFSHAWFDFRNKKDQYTDYFNNSIIATEAHKQFCISLNSQYVDYSASLWGISSSDSANGYQVWGGPPAMGKIDGSIVPNALGGSLAFLPNDALTALQNLYNNYNSKVWTQYGFADVFNPLTSFVGPDILAIDQGIQVLMAENNRTGFVWSTFMQNAEVIAAMSAVGFVAD